LISSDNDEFDYLLSFLYFTCSPFPRTPSSLSFNLNTQYRWPVLSDKTQLGKDTSYLLVKTDLAVSTIYRTVERAATLTTDIVKSPWYLPSWSRDLPPAWDTARTRRVARIKSAAIREAKEPSAGGTFVIWTTCISSSIVASREH
jgi:hypothetical protein